MIYFERNNKLLSQYQKDVYETMQKPESVNSFKNTLVGFGQNDKGEMDNIVINLDGKLFVAGTEAEAANWIKSIETQGHTFIIFGLGLGYHIENLIDKYPTAKIIVIEPDKRILAHAMYLKDMEKIFRNCIIWLDKPVIECKMKVFEMITHPLSRGISILPFFSAVYQEYSDSLYAEFQKMMNDFCVMLNTKRSLSDKWYGNRIVNAKQQSVNLASLIGKFKDIPGILVGAGPSLMTQIDKIKALNGKAIIIAASTAAEILKTHGIKPTFMIAIDQDPITSGALHENMDGDIPLIFDGQVAQNSLHYKGRKFQMLLNVNRYTGMVVPNIPIIESGPSVANVTLDLLHKFGCSPILICGLDMSYTNNKLYCDGTQFNKDVQCDDRLIKLQGIGGKDCYTEPSFLAMRNWYEEYVSRIKPPVSNCTAEGVIIAGIENKSLDDFQFTIDYNIEKMVDDNYYKPDSKEPNNIDIGMAEKVNKELIAELDMIKDSVQKVGGITPEISKLRAWFLLDEFVSATVYLHEVRCEHSISKGEDTVTAIKKFQKKRAETILEQVEVLRALLV